MSLSAEGLPAGDTVGYDLLDKQGITTSEFRQRVDYQRALEGELSKTITAIEGVEAATVHVVIPEEDLFTDDAKQPTASVLVKTAARQDARAASRSRPSSTSSPPASRASTPSRSPWPTTRATCSPPPARTARPSPPATPAASRPASSRRELAESLESMLTPVVGTERRGRRGPRGARTSTDEPRDHASSSTRSGIPLSSSTTRETYTGTGSAGVGGVLGPDGAPPHRSTTGGTDYEKRRREQQFAVGKVTSEIKTAPGDVERLSVAVLLDDGAEADYGTGEIEDLVTAAAGLDPAAWRHRRR